MTKKVIVVCGPTASGKTALGIDLANKVGGEIVSADSMQIYRRMDIGTAKATKEEQLLAVHHMIDIVDPEEDYSVSRYVNDAVRCCEDIFSRGGIPVIVGGTGLYIDSLLSGRDFSARPSDESLRTALGDKYDTIGGLEMLKELSSFDPDRAAILKPNDRKRIIRAFEVFITSGETITSHDNRTKNIPPRYECEYHVLGLDDRQALYDRINLRVDGMIRQGLVDEVRSLLEDVPRIATSMQAIGYKEIVSYLDGSLSLDEAVDLIKMSSRRYAKRQVTWFKKYGNI